MRKIYSSFELKIEMWGTGMCMLWIFLTKFIFKIFPFVYVHLCINYVPFTFLVSVFLY